MEGLKMVESNEDPEIVTATIVRESARAQREKPETPVAELRAPPPPEAANGVLSVVVQPVEPQAAQDPEASFRHLRLGVCGALVLVLLLVWIAQRQSSGNS